jgi:hypothetical protein
VLTHFRGRIPSWDVVNEPFNANGSLRDCLWSRVIGGDWVEQALRFARKADPNVRLFVNEIRADVPNPRFDALETMARDFRARGVPLDGIGLQMHLTRDAPPQDEIEEAIRRLGELGLDVHISEMDVPTWYMGKTVEEKLARQAESFRRVAAACQDQPACFRLTTWGFTDRYSWRGESSLALPFDSEYRPKPAWAVLQEVLRSPPAAPPPSPPPSATPEPPPPVVSARVAPTSLKVVARVRRQRLSTWLRRRELPILVELRGSGPAHLVVVARVRRGLIATAERETPSSTTNVVRLSLTAKDRHLLRRSRGLRLLVEVAVTGQNGEQSKARAQARLR